jgi:hypothetical protein
MEMKAKASDTVSGTVKRPVRTGHNVGITVHWEWEHYREGQLIDTWEYDNTCSDEGLDHMLDVTFHGTTAISPWYVEIFESDTTPDGDTTYATPVYTPCTAYDEATRPEYEEAAASSQVTTNTANKAEFTISGTKTIYGAALVGGGSAATTKGDTAGGGTLFSASKFAAAKNVVDDDVLNVTIAVTLADS